MIKYSFIVPCYNGEDYIERCLGSILKQKKNNYEIIVINDGSTDNSKNILSKYKNIVLYNTSNNGLSAARNLGIEKSNGEYLIFVDIDDYIKEDFLEVIDKKIKNEDMLKIGVTKINIDLSEEKMNNCTFDITNGEDAFNKFIDSKIIFEMASCYIVKREYIINNNFYFEVGKYHEDFGIIPYMIINAKSISSIDYYGYMYVQTENSITRNSSEKKEYTKSMDVLYFFDQYNNLLKIDEKINKKFISYIANACINKLPKLNNFYRKKYKNELKQRHIYKYLYSDTLKRKIKKVLAFINLDFIVYK